LRDGLAVTNASANEDIEIILDTTPFYAEGGGQLADGGTITLASGAIIEIIDVQSPIKGLSTHRGRVISGEVTVGEKAFAEIDNERRNAISRAHTATHMVHKAFREILGETATQAGSENSPGRLRFDFPATGAVSDLILSDVEGRVNSLLLENLSVTAQVMSQESAKKIGAMALFGEKYGDEVRVVSVGDWARELCGGTHVASSGQLGVVKLLGESSIGAGVRRVEALVGADAYQFLAREHILLNSLTSLIKGSRSEELPEKIQGLIDKLRDVEKELAALRSAQAMANVSDIRNQVKQIGKFSFIGSVLGDGISGDDLRAIAVELRQSSPLSVIALISTTGGRPVLVSAVGEEARAQGAKAGSLVKIGSTILGGGGGGKDDFAQGGGSDPSKSLDAIAAIASSISGI
jgi:alanyl-tRNA synthetase